jgi:hypothetical protein
MTPTPTSPRELIELPVCDVCRKPHFGRSKVEERCVCDISGQYHYELLEKENSDA